MNRDGAFVPVTFTDFILEVLPKCDSIHIGAHQDDAEIGGGIFHPDVDLSLAAVVVVTDGAGVPVPDDLKDTIKPEQIPGVRCDEQLLAGEICGCRAVACLNLPSKLAKVYDPDGPAAVTIRKMLQVKPFKLVATHNPFDRHATHVGVGVHVINELRKLAPDKLPTRAIGIEVWGSLDTFPASGLQIVPIQASIELQLAAISAFQIANKGKNYPWAAVGRRLQNVTMAESHSVDPAGAVTACHFWDLLPMVQSSDSPYAHASRTMLQIRDATLNALAKALYQ